MKKILYSKKAAPYLFILPFVLTFAIFWIVPILKSGVMSLEKVLPGQVQFIGLNNFNRLYKDRIFWLAVTNSVKYMIFTLILLIPIPMRLKDGGSVEYRAILYTITKYHKLAPIEENTEQKYIDGIAIRILGIEIYNNTKQDKTSFNSGDITAVLTLEDLVM